MQTKTGYLTYCTNIHKGETWAEHFTELKKYLPSIKSAVCPDRPMGLGLRVSKRMQNELIQGSKLSEFKDWLSENQCYVFTLNGFPYGNFHGDRIKDDVHKPDWTTIDRYEYTLRLFDILQDLLPSDMNNGGISTSPLSYRHWFSTEEDLRKATEHSTRHIIQVADYLNELNQKKGQVLHLDIEPEPDGILANGQEFIDWYETMLIPMARRYFFEKSVSKEESDRIIRRHIQLCYDVCHMAVEFENQEQLLTRLHRKDIRIGKLQLSSALKIQPGTSPGVLEPFVEDHYLHQVVIKEDSGKLIKFKDLGDALRSEVPADSEWRVHYHVPLFTESYQALHSTNDYIREILALQKSNPVTDHLEIETYTWEVLPADLQLPIDESIAREFQFIINEINQD